LINFDAFPKVESNYQERKEMGGFVSLLVACILCFLITGEFFDFIRPEIRQDFLVDPTVDVSMQINLDIVVKMPCELLSIDVLDTAGESYNVLTKIKEFPALFNADNARHLRDQAGYRYNSNVREIVRATEGPNLIQNSPLPAGVVPDACRLAGSINVDKVVGNLHITALGHGHGSVHAPHAAINFTHRVNTLSFGKHFPLMNNPLDNSVEIATTTWEYFKYFVSVVPTIYNDGSRYLFTNQYAVSEKMKKISELHGSPTEVPGIFFQYSIQPVSVRITREQEDVATFLVRIFGIIGGIWVTFGLAYRGVLKLGEWKAAYVPALKKI